MSSNIKPDENQVWTTILMVLPITMLLPVSSVLANDGYMQVLYAGALGLAGGVIGAIAIFLSKDKARPFKIGLTISIILICGITIYLLNPAKKEVAKKEVFDEWVTQMIGHIEFDAPSMLTLQSSSIPESASEFYNKLSIYSDGETDRTISFIESTVLNDSLNLEQAFNSSLESMLVKMDVDLRQVEYQIIEADDEFMSATFSFELNNHNVNGYGLMFLSEPILESVWLLPLSIGFSEEFIEEFDAGILIYEE